MKIFRGFFSGYGGWGGNSRGGSSLLGLGGSGPTQHHRSPMMSHQGGRKDPRALINYQDLDAPDEDIF